MAPEKMDEMADDPRNHSEAILNAFLRHKGLEQTQHYLTRGRRFAKQLNADWIIAVRSWLAHKIAQMNERRMAELRLRVVEPPYAAVKQELADRSAQTQETERKKVLRAVARKIGNFMRENQSPLQ